jgi:hypothetical protein
VLVASIGGIAGCATAFILIDKPATCHVVEKRAALRSLQITPASSPSVYESREGETAWTRNA